MNLVQHIAQTGDAKARCINQGNMEWLIKHRAELARVASDVLPHGSGFDRTATILLAGAEKIAIVAPYHKMNDVGMYTEWVNFKIVVKPNLVHGFVLSVYGGTAADKEYVSDVYHEVLGQEYHV